MCENTLESYWWKATPILVSNTMAVPFSDPEITPLASKTG